MREQFVKTLMELARKDDRIWLLTPDVGFNHLEKFRDEFPDRFINTGITEQSTIGIAAGLALSGKKPYVYSMINFVTMRPYEYVRNDIAYHNADVKLVGVGGKDYYQFLGFTHNPYDGEDLKMMYNLPNMEVFVPPDKKSVKKALEISYKSSGSAYIRL